MGYSVSIIARSLDAQGEMLLFLERHWRSPEDLLGHGSSSEPRTDLAYSSRKNQIGFDFNTSGRERFYLFSLCQWMALKIGEPRSIFQMEKGSILLLGKPVPYILYDGTATWPVFEGPVPVGVTWRKGDPLDLEGCCVEETGVSKILGLDDCDPCCLWTKVLGYVVYHPELFREDNRAEWGRLKDRAFQREIRQHLLPILNEMQRLNHLWVAG